MRLVQVVIPVVAAIALVSIGAPAVSNTVASAKAVENQLMGCWQGIAGHWGRENPPPKSHSFTFSKDHQFQAEITDVTLSGQYRIDLSQRPYHIDFTFEYKGETSTTKTIFDFTKDGHLRIAEWDTNWRRKQIDPGITFERIGSSNKPDAGDGK
jgi:hypothetical protein